MHVAGKLLPLFAAVILFIQSTYALKCKNEKNEDVDWYFVYKIPELIDKGEPFSTGYAYVYMTSNDFENGWQLSPVLVDDQESIFAHTLKPLYSNKNNDQFSHVFYSDQPPNGEPTESYGHTKGVLAVDQSTGFWLIHSVPKFVSPVSTGQYGYPSSGRRNGQTALCFSFDTKTETEKIVKQFLHNQPKVYDHSVSSVILSLVPSFKDLLNENWIRNEKSEALIYSTSGHQFISFAKGAKVVEDLYDSFVAPSLESNLFVETWRRGAGTPLKSECDLRYHVKNVDYININGARWHYLEDHSKWAITETSDEKINKAYTCVGDINRMKSQFKRGGGTVCFNDLNIWKIFKASVEGIEPCPKNTSFEYEKQWTNFEHLSDMFFEALLFLGEIIIQIISEVLM
ncbi:plancitoxin-1-like protein [Leptotrombidium deliense]|uniref:Plancitoxin-1-like protein n=1 Tax=Leptotrombidium deliense TaxID=299467 RepID=A0A443S9I9_9ACAR|nr:plancitoxin-1-like protein [Leptotrombidium deliense]